MYFWKLTLFYSSAEPKSLLPPSPEKERFAFLDLEGGLSEHATPLTIRGDHIFEARLSADATNRLHGNDVQNG